MSDFSVDEFRRPTTLAMAALAIVGWLLVAYFWSQTGELRTAMDDSLHRAEVARQGLAADLQNLQKAAGTEAELKKKADDAAKSLADAVAAPVTERFNAPTVAAARGARWKTVGAGAVSVAVTVIEFKGDVEFDGAAAAGLMSD